MYIGKSLISDFVDSGGVVLIECECVCTGGTERLEGSGFRWVWGVSLGSGFEWVCGGSLLGGRWEGGFAEGVWVDCNND